jgi:hypothetical protein
VSRGSFLALAAISLAGCASAPDAEPLPPARAAEPQTAELRWREEYPPTGQQLRFHVERLEVAEDGWSAEVGVENATQVPFELGSRPLALQFGLMLFGTGSLDEVEAASRAGALPAVRTATAIEPPPPAVLGPGVTWRATISAPGSLADGAFARVTFGTFFARGDPPAGMEPTVVWITDQSHRL